MLYSVDAAAFGQAVEWLIPFAKAAQGSVACEGCEVAA
jgi:hypothetical protein